MKRYSTRRELEIEGAGQRLPQQILIFTYLGNVVRLLFYDVFACPSNELPLARDR